MSIEDMCQQVGTVKSPVVSMGSAGGESRTFTARDGLADIAVSIQAQRGTLIESFHRRGINISHSIYSAVDLSTAQLGDRFDADDGRMFVVRQHADMGAQGRAWMLYVDQLPPES